MNLKNDVKKKLLQQKDEEIADLRDQLLDMDVLQKKVQTQEALIQRLQARIQNLNFYINYGSERPTVTTIEDVKKLTGEIETEEPGLVELEKRLEDDNV